MVGGLGCIYHPRRCECVQHVAPERRLKDVPWTLLLARFEWCWIPPRRSADVLGKSGRVCVSSKRRYWRTNPSIRVVSWVEESHSRCPQSNPAFRATRPVCGGGAEGGSSFLTFAHPPYDRKRSVYVPVETNDKLVNDTGIPSEMEKYWTVYRRPDPLP